MARTKELTDQSGPRGTAWPRSSPRRRNQPKARFSALSAPRRWRCAPVIGVVDTDPADPGHGRPALFPACVVAGLRSASASDRAPWIRVLRIRKLRLRRCSLDIAQQHGGSERKQDDGHVLPNYRLNGSRRTKCCACEARIRRPVYLELSHIEPASSDSGNPVRCEQREGAFCGGRNPDRW